MFYLILVSVIWAFSFGLIKGQLTGLDPSVVAAARLLLSLLVFLPFVRLQRCRLHQMSALILIGAIQYGLMYVAYTTSFRYLHAYEVALFTIFTPIYVTLINDLFSRRFHRRFFYAALLAVIGTAIVLYRDFHHGDFRQGFILLQGANLCFAFGQVAYTRVMKNIAHSDLQVFGLLYLGAFLSTVPMIWGKSLHDLMQMTLTQSASLVYLGVLASGICFFLWNHGARQVNAGTLAVCNNLKIPLAIACSALVFSETVNWPQLLIGSAILAFSLLLNHWHLKRLR
nr:EamA family transporter [uncultured Desulfuromonas sp.]